MIYLIIATSLILLGLLLLGYREGLVVKDLLEIKPTPKESDQWHLIGLLSRICFVLSITAIWINEGHIWLLIIFTCSGLLLISVWYNISINLSNGWKWNYLGGGKIDTFLKNLFK